MNDVLTLKQAAQYLSLHPEVLRKKAASGEIPSKKLGTGKRAHWRFLKSELDALVGKVEAVVLQSSTQEPDSDSGNKEIRKLIEILQTSDDHSRQETAIHSTMLLDAKEALPHVIPFVESPFENLRWLAVRTVTTLMGDASRALVYHLLDSDESDRVKLQIASHFGHAENDEKSIRYLTTMFETAADKLRRIAAYSLVGLRSDLAIPFLRKELRSGIRPLQYKALVMLRSVEYPERIDDWQWILDNESVEKIRLKAIEIAGMKQAKPLAKRLERLLTEDDSEEVRQAAALALARIYGYEG